MATLLILAGLFVEIVMPLGILTGTADRLAALVMAGYCMVTALLWKQFWKPGDFWQAGDSRARGLFWDFLKKLLACWRLFAAHLRHGCGWRRGVPSGSLRIVAPLFQVAMRC